jgi:hypothetical protein
LDSVGDDFPASAAGFTLLLRLPPRRPFGCIDLTLLGGGAWLFGTTLGPGGGGGGGGGGVEALGGIMLGGRDGALIDDSLFGGGPLIEPCLLLGGGPRIELFLAPILWTELYLELFSSLGAGGACLTDDALGTC